jgi:hypothetical protein
MKAQYVGRKPGIVPKLLNLDRYAAEVLERMASHGRAQGQFVSALILGEQARREERARLRSLLEDPNEEAQSRPVHCGP